MDSGNNNTQILTTCPPNEMKCLNLERIAEPETCLFFKNSLRLSNVFLIKLSILNISLGEAINSLTRVTFREKKLKKILILNPFETHNILKTTHFIWYDENLHQLYT